MIIFLAIGVSAYAYKIPICTAENSTNCLNTFMTSGVDGNPALVFYQDGHFYITNETGYGFNSTITYLNTSYFNVTNISYFNVTNITHQNISYITYHINNSNGSSFTFQNNITLDKNHVKTLFDEIYNNTNHSRINRTQLDSIYASQDQFNNLINNMGLYATKGELVTLESRFSNINNLNNIDWASFNLTRINEFIDKGGNFNTFWKSIIIIEGIIIILLLLFIVKTMMSEY
jgi:hypothetical protein